MPTKKGLEEAIIDLRYNSIEDLVKDALVSGMKPIDVLNALRSGLTIVGDKYQSGEYFLSQLFLAAETMKNALEVLQPLISKERKEKSKGTIVIGSIEGDIHDFGKAIVSSLLIAAGLIVVDIGVDVPANKFVDEALASRADVIGVSALLSTTQPSCKKVIEELERRGLRDKVKVILGGTGVIPEIALNDYGADAAVNDGVEGVKIISKWMEERAEL